MLYILHILISRQNVTATVHESEEMGSSQSSNSERVHAYFYGDKASGGVTGVLRPWRDQTDQGVWVNAEGRLFLNV